jgi:hypothetical protein
LLSLAKARSSQNNIFCHSGILSVIPAKAGIQFFQLVIKFPGNISMSPGSFRKNPPQSPFLKGGTYRNALPY